MARQSLFPVRLSYPKLIHLYKQHGVEKNRYQEPDKMRGKRVRSKLQIDQLQAMLLADIKVLEHRVIYIDLVKACLEDLNLVFRPINSNKLASNQGNNNQDTVWLQAAIDSQIGLLGFQIYFKMPTEKDMASFIVKIDLKVRKQVGTGQLAKQPRWIVSPEHSASQQRSLNTKLRDLNFKAILL